MKEIEKLAKEYLDTLKVVSKNEFNSIPLAFIAGAKSQSIIEWVSVEERLPDEGVNVLVWGEQMGASPSMSGAYAFITQRMKLTYQKHNLHLKNQFDENDFRRVAYATHWQPLPPPPPQTSK